MFSFILLQHNYFILLHMKPHHKCYNNFAGSCINKAIAAPKHARKCANDQLHITSNYSILILALLTRIKSCFVSTEILSRKVVSLLFLW